MITQPRKRRLVCDNPVPWCGDDRDEMPERNPHIYATGARTPCTMKTSQVAGRKINFVLAKRNDFRIGSLEHAQIDRLRRRYVRQAQTAGARPDGDFPEIGGGGVCGLAKKQRLP